VILQHVLIPEGSLAHSTSKDLIFAIRLGTDGRTDRVCTLRRGLRLQFDGFSLRGTTPPDDSIIVIARHIVVVTVVVIVIIVIIIIVIIVAPGRRLRVGNRRYFWQWAKGGGRRGCDSRRDPISEKILRVERWRRCEGGV